MYVYRKPGCTFHRAGNAPCKGCSTRNLLVSFVLCLISYTNTACHIP